MMNHSSCCVNLRLAGRGCVFRQGFLVTACLLTLFSPSADPVWAVDSVDDLTGPWHLFVDDYPVATKANVVRTYHPFQKHAGNPVLITDKPWEGLVYLYGTVLPDETRTGYRMWYHTLRTNKACSDASRELYATSTDGINWVKPILNLRVGCGATTNNMYFTRPTPGGLTSVMQTPWDPDPAQRYKFMSYDSGDFWAAWSSNGINVVDAPNNPVFTGGSDVGQFSWDPHTQLYRGYVKNGWIDSNGRQRRAVALTTTTNINYWPQESLILWPDAFDDRWIIPGSVQRTHFYGLSAFAYERMYIGFLWIFRATELDGELPGYLIGPCFVELVSSHDGVNWTREEGDRPPILPLGPPGSWDDGMVFTARAPLVEGDTMKLWYGGFDEVHGTALDKTRGSIGLATLRKDGFASLDAGASVGSIVTESLTEVAGPLRVNYRAVGGSLKVEVLDANYNVVPGYSQADCIPLTGDSVDRTVTWMTHSELPAGMTLLRLRFILQNASVYSFMAGESASLPQSPTIRQHPSSRTNFIGSVATFNVRAVGAPAPDYQWQKNEANLTNGGHYSGCTTATLTIAGADETDVASYHCVVTNFSGGVTSSPATLTVQGATCIEIANADFESGFSLAGGGYIANNWTEWEAAPSVTTGYEETTIIHGGARAQRIRVWGVSSGTSGGAYQRLPITPGQPFSVSVWMYAADALSSCSLGVDPTGGTNAAGAVIWSSSTTNVAWVQRTLAGIATGDHITVFLKVTSSDVNKRNGYFDNAMPGAPAGPPPLTAQPNGNALTLTWSECPNARLEHAESLLPPVSWSPVTNQPSIVGGQKVVTLSPNPQSQTGFFRLVLE